jgi:hypothetical protein
MASKKEQEKEIMVDMSELIAMLIRETVDADQAVTRDYLNEIQDYAFEMNDKDHPKLKTISFEMTDDEGQRQRVTVPLLSLLPLPVLHISEATFDLETQMSIVEETITEENTTTEDGNNESTNEVKPMPESTLLPDSNMVQAGPARVDYIDFEGHKKINKAVRVRRIRTSIPTARGTENLEQITDNPILKKGESPKQQFFNAKIHVKLEQTPLPSGMMGMLQETDRSITTTLIE